MARVDGLDLRKRQLLQTRVGDRRQLSRRRPGGRRRQSGASSTTSIDELVEAEFLAHSGSTVAARVHLRHPLIQEVTYDSLLHEPPRRAAPQGGRGDGAHRCPRRCRAMPACSPITTARARRPSAPRRSSFAPAPMRRAQPRRVKALHFFEEASRLYLELHGERGDPEKRVAAREKHRAGALLPRPVHRGDRALQPGPRPPGRSRPRGQGSRSVCALPRQSRVRPGAALRTALGSAAARRDRPPARDHGSAVRAGPRPRRPPSRRDMSSTAWRVSPSSSASILPPYPSPAGSLPEQRRSSRSVASRST